MQAMIIEKAKGYLVENYGNLTSTGRVYFNKKDNTWSVKIIVRSNKGIIPVGELVFDTNGNIIEVPTKETLLNILRIRLSKEKEKVIIKVPAEDLPEIKRVAKDILVL